MKTRSRSAILALVLAIGSIGCLSAQHQHSAYRSVHKYALAGDVPALTADIKAHPGDLNLPDDSGRTPLHLAASRCRLDAVSFLLDHGATINQRAMGGSTPLHFAAQEGCLEGVKILLTRGADINARDNEGRTALKRAEEWHRDAVAELLQQKGGIE